MATVAEACFKTCQKDVVVIALGAGDKELTIKMLPPTKEIHDDLMNLSERLDLIAGGEIALDGIDMRTYLEVAANAMSNNTDLRVVTADYLESIDFEMIDILEFIGLYLYFLSELVKPKN